MHLKQLFLKNFRCFGETTLTFDHPLILIEGMNGVGKTSVLEALHYLCYLRSFRTHSPRELLHFGQDNFFIKASFNTDDYEPCDLQVGFSAKKRLVKINQQLVGSYRQLMDFYRVVTLTEDDMVLIGGGPEVRRAFIDQALIVYNPELIVLLRDLRHTIEQRNSFLQQGMRNNDLWRVLTDRLWHLSSQLQQQRQAVLASIERVARNFLAVYFENFITISLSYCAKKMMAHQTMDQFYTESADLFREERRFGRSLFGAHLDDFIIHGKERRSKSFASRGQQKLILLLIKLAQLHGLIQTKGPSLLLLDDFMTDFDVIRIDRALAGVASLNTQVIFTVPSRVNQLEEALIARQAHKILLTH